MPNTGTWQDVNDPGTFKKDTETEQQASTQSDEQTAAAEETKPEYRFKSIKAIEPAQGFEIGKPFDIEGEVEKIAEITRPRVMLYPVGVYGTEKDELVPAGVEASIDTATLKFKGTCQKLFECDPYARDDDKAADATWDLVIRAEGTTAQESKESDKVTFPQPVKFVALQKGHYDENGAQKYGKEKSGDNYKTNNVVKALQSDLIKCKFLVKNDDDGFFGGGTEKAVKSFQDYAIKDSRMKRSVGKVEKTDKKLELAQSDGIVEKKTRDELDRWLQNDWVKPVPTVRHKEYDDKGAHNGKGKKGADDHHVDKPVAEAQDILSKVSAYWGQIDGWFGDKMKQSVEVIKKHAKEDSFLVNGVVTALGLASPVIMAGVIDYKLIEYLKKVIEKGGTVPTDIYGYPGGTTGTMTLKDAQDIALKVTEAFEGEGGAKSLCGNSDGQGVSWGKMQWNFGQDTLGPILKKMKNKDSAKFKQAFNGNDVDYNKFVEVIDTFTVSQQLTWANTIQSASFVINTTWKGYFDALAGVSDFVKIQDEDAINTNHKLTKNKVDWLREKLPDLFKKITLRGYVALFDLSNQQSNLGATTTKLETMWKNKPPKTQFEAVEKAVYERGLASSGKGGIYRSDCISRRLGILNAKLYPVEKDAGKGIVTAASRSNKQYSLLTQDKVISDL